MTEDDHIDNPMDTDSLPYFIQNANNLHSRLANLVGGLYLPKLVEGEQSGRRRINTSPFTRAMKVDYYLNGHEDVIFDKVRMDADTFEQLSSLLKAWGLLHSTQNMTVEAQLFIFLCIISKAYTIRDSVDH